MSWPFFWQSLGVGGEIRLFPQQPLERGVGPLSSLWPHAEQPCLPKGCHQTGGPRAPRKKVAVGLPCPLTGCGSFNKLPVGTWLCLSLPLLLSSFIFSFQEKSFSKAFKNASLAEKHPGTPQGEGK